MAAIPARTPRVRIRVSATSVFMLLLAGGLGFMLVAQLGSTERFSRRLQAESEGDLARILSNLTTSDAHLRDETGTLKLQLQTLQTSSRQDAAAQAAAAEQ